MALHKMRRPDQSAGHSKSQTANHYRAIVEYAPEILALLGADGIIQCANPHTEKVLGYHSHAVEGRNIFEFIHPDDIPRAAQEYSKTIQEQGEYIPSVLRLRDANGAWIPFEIIANNRLRDPTVQAVVFTARDLRFRSEIEAAIRQTNVDTTRDTSERITELAKINAELRIENQARREAERRLEHTISLLHATLDSTADGILVVSRDGTVSSCNRRFMEMWRMSCETSVGKDDEKLLTYVLDQLQSPNEFLDRVRALYSNPSDTSFDILHLRDGRIFERYSQPQRIDDAIVGRVWSFRDVTRARKLELELRQSQKMEALGRLAGGIAHDFNNLLMLISGYVTQMLDNPSLKEGHDICRQILTSTKRAASVTKQLLAFSRKLPDTPSLADLNVIVGDMEQLLRRLLTDQIQLQISLTSDPQPVLVDVSQIELVIMNLAINAQDAMPQGGLLSLATSREEVASAGNKTNVFCVLQVSDTGSGMTPEIQSHIFEPFFTTKGVGQGTGLGLSTVVGIVERAGGHIRVDTKLNHGTTFKIYLPHVDAQPLATSPSLVLLPSRGHETILVAEDEAGIRAMTRAYLESLGYQVLEAADGTEAIRVSMEYSGVIDLVLTDVLMPGIRGDAVVEEIRRRRPGVKAIFMSGYTDQDLTSNAETMLQKPFDFPELGRRVRKILDGTIPSRPI